MNRNKKGFTLIELLAVLVILTILVTIGIVLVFSLIKNSKISANKRSVDGYGKAIEVSINDYFLGTGSYPKSIDSLKIDYTGKKVDCDEFIINSNGSVYLSKCSVDGKEVKDSHSEDGWYHYGKKTSFINKDIDAYGQAIEKAIEQYKNGHDKYPNNLSDLNIDYSEKNISCISRIQYDGSIYLTKCKVDGKFIEDVNSDDGYYHYGKIVNKEYKIGDVVTYNNMRFYVIENSDKNSDTVKLLKAEPLTTLEITSMGEYDVTDVNGYGTIVYGNNSNYNNSYVKQIVDDWVNHNIDIEYLKKDDSGYSARILNSDDLVSNLGYKYHFDGTYAAFERDTTPNWVDNPGGWIISIYNDDSNKHVYWLSNSKYVYEGYIIDGRNERILQFVRPVINIKKVFLD